MRNRLSSHGVLYGFAVNYRKEIFHIANYLVCLMSFICEIPHKHNHFLFKQKIFILFFLIWWWTISWKIKRSSVDSVIMRWNQLSLAYVDGLVWISPGWCQVTGSTIWLWRFQVAALNISNLFIVTYVRIKSITWGTIS